MKILKITLSIALVAFFMQSCLDIYTDPTYMEDYLVAPEYTPDVTYDASDLYGWDRLPGDGEEYYPNIYQVTNKPGSMIYRKSYGIRFDAYGGWWDQRFYRTGFDVNGDFEIEFKVRIVQGTGDAFWQKAGIFVGDIGGNPANLWLSLENPVEPNNGRVNRYIPGSNPEWLNLDEGNFSVFDWQVIKAVRTGNNLKIYRNGNMILDYTNNLVNNINGKVGISAEALSGEYEYLTVNGVKDDFTDMDNWANLDKIPVLPPSKWTLNDTILNVVASYGWHHRAVGEVVSGDFTIETKVRMNSTNSRYPKAGIMIGELGDDAPSLIYAIDANVDVNNGNSVVKFFPGRPGGEWSNVVPNDFNSNDWHSLRLDKIGDVMYVYVDGVRVFFEKGHYISNISGKMGLLVEGCDADFEFVSYKAN
jgi:hypothetical protein